MQRQPRVHPEYTVEYFNQTLDHFNALTAKGTAAVFKQKYLLTEKYWGGLSSPIFVFTGAEGGDVTKLYDYAYGHAVDVAKRHKALIIFLEHRFFGHSLPFGSNESFWPQSDRLGLLSVEQSLADYVTIISHVKDVKKAWSSPVVTFGGSLAGTLSAFMRIKYPNVVDIAWSSSSPLLGYPGLADQYAWRKQITDNFETLSPGCPDLVRRGFVAFQGADVGTVHQLFKVCEAPYPALVNDVQGVAWGVLEGDGEFVYPTANSQIPAHCKAMNASGHPSASSLKEKIDLGIFQRLVWAGAQRFVSGSGNSSCFNLTKFNAERRTPDSKGWDYLACTEIVHPIGSNNKTDMFPPDQWSLKQLEAWCWPQFGVPARPSWLPSEMGMAHMDRFKESASKIVFVYGLLDPWHTQGVGLANLSASLPVVTVADGSHCPDLAESQTSLNPTTFGVVSFVVQLNFVLVILFHGDVARCNQVGMI